MNVEEWLDLYLSRSPEYIEHGERWRRVVGYEGLYEVSDMGRIKSLWFRNRRISVPRQQPIVLAGSKGTYLQFYAGHWTRPPQFITVHSAVLCAFVGPRPLGYQGAHWNNNRYDNRLANLRWATPSDNGLDKRRHGTALIGARNHQTKVLPATAAEMSALRPAYTYREIADLYSVSIGTAWRACNAKNLSNKVGGGKCRQSIRTL